MSHSKKQLTSPFLAGDSHGHLNKKRKTKRGPQEPVVIRKGVLSHSGSLLVLPLGALFLGYVFNVVDLRTTLDGLAGKLDRGAHAHTLDVTSVYLSLLPLVGLLLTAFLLWIVFSNLGTVKGKSKGKAGRVAEPAEELSIHQFAALVQEQGVGVEVARAVYRVLLPAYRTRMRSILFKSLSRDLRKDPMDIEDLYRRMVQALGCRQGHAGSHGDSDTLVELMQCLERRKHGKLQDGSTREPAVEAGPVGAGPATGGPARLGPARGGPAQPAQVTPAKRHSWIRPAQLGVPDQGRVVSLVGGR